MERKIGEIFTCGDKTYQVVKVDIGIGCIGCAFKTSGCSKYKPFLGHCSHMFRHDNTGVIFKLINNNMEIKNNQLTIEIPEGMEIDLKNSDLTKGIVKFKKHNIAYNDILQVCPTNFGGVRVRTHCMDKIIAISQLMNIAKYYNGDWEPDWNDVNEYKYFIIYNGNTYKVDYIWKDIYNIIYFKNKEDVQAVIDNPHFKNILDNIYKN